MIPSLAREFEGRRLRLIPPPPDLIIRPESQTSMPKRRKGVEPSRQFPLIEASETRCWLVSCTCSCWSPFEPPPGFLLVTPNAERLKVLRIARSTSAKRPDVMHMEPDVRTCRHERLPLAVPWESPRPSALNTSAVVPAQDLKAELLPFLALSAASSIECIVPLPVLALFLSLG